jgi:imidazolonepropionase-like amidohydrolase
MPVALDESGALNVLTAWAASGVCLVRDTGSPGGSMLQLDRVPGLPRVQAAGRFLAPAGRYFPALLPEAAPPERLAELAVGELARGGRWVKVIADFPPVTDGLPSGPPALTYSREVIEAMVAAVHSAGGRVAAHVTTDVVSDLVRAGVDSVEHGTAIDESVLRLMARTGAAWTPTLCAVLGLPDTASEATQRRVAEYRQRLPELLPLAYRLGVPILAGTDTAGTIAREVALLAEHGLEPTAALKAATTIGYRYLGEPFDRAGQPTTLVTYQDDPREDLAILSLPTAVIIDGVRVR